MSPVIEWLNTSLKDIEHKFFGDVSNVEEAETKPMDDGQIVMISNINRTILTVTKKNGEKKTLKAIFKMEALAGPGKEMAADCHAFPTEILMYGTVLKSMEKLIMEINDEGCFWAECFHCGDNKLLFQDLCDDGYRVVPTYQFLDVDHTLLVMKAIGRFHGLSMVMKGRQLLDSELFQMPYYARKLPMMDAVYKHSITFLTKFMREKWGPEWSSVPERLEKFLEKPGEIMHDAWKSTLGKWNVLNHGDFTMRNMLFHYQPNQTKPDDIKFVDFQMCHYSCLANDLASLLYTSLRPQVREANMDLFIQTYLKSLSSTLKLYEFEAPIPTLQEVKDTLKCLSPLIVANLLITIPFFIMAGKQDLQKKADEYFEKMGDTNEFKKSLEEGTLNPEDQQMMSLDLDDADVKATLQYELKRCLRENIF